MKQLETDIKNGDFKNIYVFYGSQDYLKKRYTEALTGVLVPAGDTMNFASFYGKKTDLKEVIALCDTMPFLSEHRVILLENTGLFSAACEELAEYIPNISDTSVLIFSEEKVDARLKQTKAAKAKGSVVEFTDLSEADLRKWIMQRLSKEHRQITSNALDMFVERCGSDLWQVSNELEKVISYTFGKDGIRKEDVDAVCPPPAEDKIFYMISAIFDNDTETALRYYKDLLTLRTEPVSILSLIREQFRLIYHAGQMSKENVSLKDMADVMKLRDTRVKMALPVARKSSKIRLTEGIDACALTEQRIKSGLIDARVGVETLIIELSKRR